VVGRTFFQENSDDPGSENSLLRALTLHKSTEALADYGVLNHAADLRTFPKRYLGNIYVLARFFEEISETEPRVASAQDFLGPIANEPRPHGMAGRTSVGSN
jgi:hypothetical protein